MGLGDDVQVRLLALAVVFLVVLGGMTAVARSIDTGSDEVVAIDERPEAPKAIFGRGPDDLLALSDPQTLDLNAVGYRLAPGASVYAVRVIEDGDQLRYIDFVAGGGALTEDFWPASSIKLLAALGALDLAASLGFTGAATVAFDGAYPEADDRVTLRDVYRGAVLDSDNFDYDILIRIAGFDRLNSRFLNAGNGFPATVLQRSYAGIDVRQSPEMTLEEDGRRVVVPARESSQEYGCPDLGNCTNLFEMSEAVRRVVLDDALPDKERFDISADDVEALDDALAGSESFFTAGARQVLGRGTTVRSKPGVAPGLDCVDTAVVTAPDGGHYLLSASIPDTDFDFECGGLSDLAAAVLRLLVGR